MLARLHARSMLRHRLDNSQQTLNSIENYEGYGMDISLALELSMKAVVEKANCAPAPLSQQARQTHIFLSSLHQELCAMKRDSRQSVDLLTSQINAVFEDMRSEEFTLLAVWNRHTWLSLDMRIDLQCLNMLTFVL